MNFTGFTWINPQVQTDTCYAPMYTRPPTLNAGIYQRMLASEAQPDPRLYPVSLNSLTQMYAIQLRDFHHVKDPNLIKVCDPKVLNVCENQVRNNE